MERDFEGPLHDALGDSRMTARCYWEGRGRGWGDERLAEIPVFPLSFQILSLGVTDSIFVQLVF
eukprot:scaffold67466_cov42-Tisochrysis_lutea.AAC.1